MDRPEDQHQGAPREASDRHQTQRRDELARRLSALGIEPAAIEQAARHGRLLQLAAERVLAEDHRYTARDIVERAGVEPEMFLAHMTALGRPRPARYECAFGEEDLKAAKRIRVFRDLGFPDEALLDQARTFRPALNHIAEAAVRLFGATALAERS